LSGDEPKPAPTFVSGLQAYPYFLFLPAGGAAAAAVAVRGGGDRRGRAARAY
jgi:hypothetical protein